jgi:uncharacterized membrane protein YbhN (UPF0104 family)
LAAFVVLSVLSILPRALTLAALARRRSGGPPPLGACFHAQAVGQLLYNLLPARLGEAARPVALARAGDVRLTSAVAAVALGRLFDLLALIATLSLPSLALGVGDLPALRAFALLGGAVGCVLLTLLWIAARHPSALIRAAGRIGPRSANVAAGLAAGLSVLRSRRRMAVAALGALSAPLLVAASYGAALYAFRLDALPLGSSLALAATVLVAISLPAGPSSIGVYEAAVSWLLRSLGAPAAAAAAFAIATHALGAVLFVGIGAVSLYAVGKR